MAYIGGKRESRRLLGDVILQQQDIQEQREFPDASVTTTWSIDLHYPMPENSKYFPGREFRSIAKMHSIKPYPIPYRCLYSRNIQNLMMAGRNISVTHVALGTVRVQRTTGMMGEVLGMAASLCKKHNTNPRGVYQNHLEKLKELMRHGTGKVSNSVGMLELWNSAWPAGVTMLVLGSGFAVVLLIASEKLKVELDPKIEQIHAALPNLDCGACGFAGCGQYAKAVLEDPELLGKCAPGGQESTEAIAKILNLQISDSGAPKRPIVHCRAHTTDKNAYGKYQGILSCTAANALPNVQACKFGCLGFGDCVSACRFDAISIVDGLATVDYEKCTGCAACSRDCPRNLIEMVPFLESYENMMTVACSSKETGKVTRSMCKVGCIGCGICVKQTDIFLLQDNLARVDYERYAPDERAETAMDKCPTGVIIHVGKTAPEPRQPGKKPAAAKA